MYDIKLTRKEVDVVLEALDKSEANPEIIRSIKYDLEKAKLTQ